MSPRQSQALADAIAAGDALFAAGDFAAAMDKYGAGLALLSDVPGMERLSARLAEAGFRLGLADLTARQDKAARPTLDRADALARRASYPEAIAAYATVIRTWPDSSYVKRSLTGIDGALSALLKKQEQAKNTTVADRLTVVTAGLASTARAADVAVAAAQKELIALLDAKVKAKAVLGTDAVKAQYPGLAEALDRYIQLYGDEKSATGRAVALQDVATVTDGVENIRNLGLADGKPAVLLSNAPRRAALAQAAMRDMGIADGLYTGILTSGGHFTPLPGLSIRSSDIAW